MPVEAEVLQQFLDSHGLTPRRNSVSFIFDCPKCGKRDKLFIRKRDGLFRCWYCVDLNGFKGAAHFALAALTDLPLDKVINELYGEDNWVAGAFLDFSLDQDFGEQLRTDVESLPEIDWPWDFLPIGNPKAHRGAAYLEGRGIPLDLAEAYDLRYVVQNRRVVFPIKVQDRLVGWQMRLIVPDKHWDEEAGKYVTVPKILSSQGIPRDQTLMYVDRLAGSDHAILCEGPVDAIKAHLCGGNVASMGKYISPGQVKVLKNSGIKKLYLALDPDAGAELSRLAGAFADLECYLLQPPPPYKDLGEMTLEQVLALFKVAPRVFPGQLLFSWR